MRLECCGLWMEGRMNTEVGSLRCLLVRSFHHAKKPEFHQGDWKKRQAFVERCVWEVRGVGDLVVETVAYYKLRPCLCSLSTSWQRLSVERQFYGPAFFLRVC